MSLANCLVRVNNKSIRYIAWSSQGIQNIGHLMGNVRLDFYRSFSEFKERYNIKTNFLSFCGVISAIKHLVMTFNQNVSQENTKLWKFSWYVLKAKNPNRIAYRKFIEKKKKKKKKKKKQPVNSQKKMNLLTGRLLTGYLISNIISKNIISNIKPFVKFFKFKLLHRSLTTNNFLKTINLGNNDLCNFWEIDWRGNSYPSFLELYGNFPLLA